MASKSASNSCLWSSAFDRGSLWMSTGGSMTWPDAYQKQARVHTHGGLSLRVSGCAWVSIELCVPKHGWTLDLCHPHTWISMCWNSVASQLHTARALTWQPGVRNQMGARGGVLLVKEKKKKKEKKKARQLISIATGLKVQSCWVRSTWVLGLILANIFISFPMDSTTPCPRQSSTQCGFAKFSFQGASFPPEEFMGTQTFHVEPKRKLEDCYRMTILGNNYYSCCACFVMQNTTGGQRMNTPVIWI